MKKTRSEQKREAIVQAAIQAFNETGFQNTSMDKIAELAQVSKRTVYNHFPSKNVLFEHIVQQTHQQFIIASQVDFQIEQSVEQQLTQIAEQELALITNSEFIRLAKVIMAECLYDQALAKQSLAQLEVSESGVKKWLDAACEHNKLTIEDTAFAAEQFISLLKSFAFWPQLLGYGETLTNSVKKQLIEETVKMFLARYKGQ